MSFVRVAWACITASFLLTAVAVLGVVLTLGRAELGAFAAPPTAVSNGAGSAAPSANPADPAPAADVPAWFAHWMAPAHRDASPATPADPSAPSRPGGANAPALALLWRQAWGLALTFLLTGALLIGVLAGVLRWARAPLKGFDAQIRALAEMRFVSLAEPRVSEWVSLSKALNVLVGRVQAMLVEREARLSDLRRRTAQDVIAGVASREAFLEHLQQGLADGSTAAVAIVRVNDLMGMNQRLGRRRTDDLLDAIATTLRARLYAVDTEGRSLGRLNGADFGVLLPALGAERLAAWLGETAAAVQALHAQRIADGEHVAWIGATTVVADEHFSAVLSRVDNMVMASEIGLQPYCLGSASQPLERIAVAQWRVMIETALDTGRCQVALFPVKARAGGVSHLEAVLQLRAADDTLIPASAFIGPAVRTGRIVALDLRAIELAGVEIERCADRVAVKVSPHSIQRPIFVERLRTVFAAARFDTSRLWIEVEESGLADSREALATLGALLREFRCRLGIAHFGRHFAALPELPGMAVDYVKLDASFCAGVSQVAGRQAYVRIAVQMAGALGIDVIAEGVTDADDLALLESIGVAGATGPWVSALPASMPTEKA